ncbi:MAG: SpoIIE family protein phosphatase [Bacteroidales bacterium]|nr:SpoIIE family protein phosphatase [Bacteroidales bacterium]
MSWRTSISFRLNLYILTGVAVIYFFVTYYNYRASRKIVLQKTTENVEQKITIAVDNIEKVIIPLKNIAGSFSQLLSTLKYSEEGIIAVQKSILRLNKNIYGCSVSFEPYKYNKDSLYFFLYAYHSGNEFAFRYFDGTEYPYFDFEWYKIPKETHQPVWAEICEDENQENYLITYSVPFFETADDSSEFTGVITVDIDNNWLNEMINKIRVLESGFGILFSSEGELLTRPAEGTVSDNLIDLLKNHNDSSHLENMAVKMLNGTNMFLPKKEFDGINAAYIAPLKSAPWYIGMVIPVNEAVTDIKELFFLNLGIGILGFALLGFLIALLTRRLTRPLTELTDASRLIYKGNYSTELPETNRNDEVAQLTKSFVAMQERMNRYIKNFRLTLEEKRNLEHELKIASHIQANMIPNQFPPFPEYRQFELYSKMFPAKGVAGDFYDYFFVNADTLFFTIGDVSGKGVPAALFMVKAITLLKREALADVSLNEILFNVNNLLTKNNDTSMFVTAICGYLNIRTGKVRLADAGHTYPLLSNTHNSFEYITLNKNVPLGVKENTQYAENEITLKKRSTLIFYTDGIIEASNLKGEMYSAERFKNLLSDQNDHKLTELARIIRISIEDFMYEVNQTDDITVLMLRYFGSNHEN